MKYDFEEEQLQLTCINLSEEIKKGEDLLNNEDITIFNSSILKIKNSDDYLIASRGWYGNIRSWDGINFIILSLFDKDLKKKKQNILDIDEKTLKDKTKFKKFKEFKKEIVTHGDKLSKGPEDPRLFYHKNEIYILLNDLTPENKRHMFISKINIEKLEYYEKTELCESLSTRFEKNWGPFIHNDKLHMVYDINPLKVFELEDNFTCKQKFSINSEILQKITNTYSELKFHIRNSTNLINLTPNIFLGLGHGVLEYKNSTDINKYLIPLLKDSKYSENDINYFKKFYKLYTGFFYKLNMKKQEITEISPFFQLPNRESKQELIFFPTSIDRDENNYVNISYNVGDNRSYFVKLHLDLINLSLYNKNNIDFLVNHNINLNYYLELIRSTRKLLGFSTKKKDYYKFADVNKVYASLKKKKSKRKPKRKTKRKTIKKFKNKLIYFYMDYCKWCEEFQKIWQQVKKNKSIKFMKINGPKNPKMTKKYNVNSYPTLVKIEGREHKLFEGERTLKNIKEFIK